MLEYGLSTFPEAHLLERRGTRAFDLGAVVDGTSFRQQPREFVEAFRLFDGSRRCDDRIGEVQCGFERVAAEWNCARRRTL